MEKLRKISEAPSTEMAEKTGIVALVGSKFHCQSRQSDGKRLDWQGFLRIIEGFAGFAVYVTSV
jgi:hypothetical protein